MTGLCPNRAKFNPVRNHPQQPVRQQGGRAGWRRFGFERWRPSNIARSEAGEAGQRAQCARETVSGKTIGPNVIGDRGQSPPRRAGEGVKPTRFGQSGVIRAEQGRSDREQGCAAAAEPVAVGMLVEQGGITVL